MDNTSHEIYLSFTEEEFKPIEMAAKHDKMSVDDWIMLAVLSECRAALNEEIERVNACIREVREKEKQPGE